ncbi:MAG: hypothetical protein V1912_07570, partial [bacterium]
MRTRPALAASGFILLSSMLSLAATSDHLGSAAYARTTANPGEATAIVQTPRTTSELPRPVSLAPRKVELSERIARIRIALERDFPGS